MQKATPQMQKATTTEVDNETGRPLLLTHVKEESSHCWYVHTREQLRLESSD